MIGGVMGRNVADARFIPLCQGHPSVRTRGWWHPMRWPRAVPCLATISHARVYRVRPVDSDSPAKSPDGCPRSRPRQGQKRSAGLGPDSAGIWLDGDCVGAVAADLPSRGMAMWPVAVRWTPPVAGDDVSMPDNDGSTSVDGGRRPPGSCASSGCPAERRVRGHHDRQRLRRFRGRMSLVGRNRGSGQASWAATPASRAAPRASIATRLPVTSYCRAAPTSRCAAARNGQLLAGDGQEPSRRCPLPAASTHVGGTSGRHAHPCLPAVSEDPSAHT